MAEDGRVTSAVSVVIPTIGRPELLRTCLESVAACSPPPQEIVVVDQSHDDAIAEVVEQFASHGARNVPDPGRGLARARNVGLKHASNAIVMQTDDDCTVKPNWVGIGAALIEADPSALFTGQVRPAGDAARVPSTIVDEAPCDYTGPPVFGVLYTGNMVCRREAVLELGAFDERVFPHAMDNDLCYRWLDRGRPIRYRPELVVWHHDWRRPEDLVKLYLRYAESQGIVYAKHLRAGDRRVLRFVMEDLHAGLRGAAGRVIRGRKPADDWRQGVLRGLPVGLYRGWRRFGP